MMAGLAVLLRNNYAYVAAFTGKCCMLLFVSSVISFNSISLFKQLFCVTTGTVVVEDNRNVLAHSLQATVQHLKLLTHDFEYSSNAFHLSLYQVHCLFLTVISGNFTTENLSVLSK